VRLLVRSIFCFVFFVCYLLFFSTAVPSTVAGLSTTICVTSPSQTSAFFFFLFLFLFTVTQAQRVRFFFPFILLLTDLSPLQLPAL
jgi:hypothetical protein